LAKSSGDFYGLFAICKLLSLASHVFKVCQILFLVCGKRQSKSKINRADVAERMKSGPHSNWTYKSQTMKFGASRRYSTSAS
jgi:hypothetical protein